MKKVFLFIALVSVFAACQPEELKTVFKSENAKLTINVSAVINSVNGATVTSEATPYPFTTEGNPDIAAGVGTVRAVYKNIEGKTDVKYPRILADSPEVVMDAIVYIPGTVGNYTINLVPVEGEDVMGNIYVLEEGYNHGYSYEGFDYWIENANDYLLFDTCTYDDYFVPEMISAEPEFVVTEHLAETKATFGEIVEQNFLTTALALEASQSIETGVEYDIEVPAWSLYQVVNVEFTRPIKYYVTATPDATAPAIGVTMDGVENVIATFDAQLFYTDLAPLRVAHPSHDSNGHYVGHGTGSNAGGGLVLAE